MIVQIVAIITVRAPHLFVLHRYGFFILCLLHTLKEKNVWEMVYIYGKKRLKVEHFINHAFTLARLMIWCNNLKLPTFWPYIGMLVNSGNICINFLGYTLEWCTLLLNGVYLPLLPRTFYHRFNLKLQSHFL